MVYPSQTPEYRRQKYLESREKLLAERRKKYATDKAYRERQIKNMQTYRAKNSDKTRERDRRRKEDSWAVQERNRIGRCQRCGYDRCMAALDWHHVDPSEKEYNPSQMYWLSQKLQKAEISKCVLICSNCHREAHAGLWEPSELFVGRVPRQKKRRVVVRLPRSLKSVRKK